MLYTQCSNVINVVFKCYTCSVQMPASKLSTLLLMNCLNIENKLVLVNKKVRLKVKT